MDQRGWVEIILALTIFVTVVLTLVSRIRTGKGLGVRAIQFLAVTIGIPVIVILALEKVVDGAVVGTLLGGVFGYLLSNIANFDKSLE
ncbi:MAG TPA: hypothetical protein VGU66_09065 [Candidatus Elarobacter sp.]|nr:hypothetical protein [Candidatus Elarobacter sp.]